MQKVVQLLRLMRFIKRIPPRLGCMLFILTSFISLTANGQDFQNGKVNLELKSVSLKEAFAEIQKQSGARFIYDQDIKKYDALKITESVKGITVKKAIELVLKGTNLQYVPEGSHVMISEKPAPKPASPTPNAAAGQGQGTGGLKGRVVELETSQPLPGATIRIIELNKATTADNGGYYHFTNLRAGKYTLQISFVSYTTESQPIEVKSGKEETYDVKMQGNNQLGEVVVRATGKTRAPVAHATEKQVLEEVKQAQSVMSGISSQQIAKTADRNAAEAIQRISGITVADDKFVVVRGLNQRYNLTYLNDNVAPSTEVNSRAFALDLIPSRIIDKILVYKSIQPENQADATGGVVKIYTKDAKTVRHFDIELQTGIRPNSTFNCNFLTYQGGKFDFLGFDDGTRKLPSAVPGYGSLNKADLSPSQYTKVFSPILNYGRKTALPNVQLTANYYNSFRLFGKSLSILSSLSYKNDQTKNLIYRQQGIGFYIGGATDKNGTDDRNVSLAQLNLLQNFTLKLRDSSTLSFKNFVLQQGQSNTIIRESVSAIQPDLVFKRDKDIILSYNQRFLYAGNLGGSHYYQQGAAHFKWNLGYTYSNQSSPDQRVIRLTAPKSSSAVGDTAMLWRARGLLGGPSDANPAALKQGIISRIWTRNNEGVYNFSADYDYRLRSWLLIKLGTFQQYKIRQLYRRIYVIHEGDVTDFTPDTYEVGANWYINPTLVRFREQQLNEVWSKKYFRDDFSGLRVNDNTSASDSYNGTEQNNSGYIAFNLKPLKDHLEIYAGLRYEYNRQKIGAAIPKQQPFFINAPILVDNPTKSWLPSVNITYRPVPSWVVRAAYGKSVNRTEFREVSPFQEYDYENNNLLSGNPNLKSAKVDNYDARVEYYPQNNKKGETISVGVFYKKLLNPIERINTSNRVESLIPEISYQNAASATIKGLEIEVRKSLDFIPLKFFRDLSVVGNLSLIRSETINDTSSTSLTLETTAKRPLQGQAPYIVNAGLYYDNPGSGTRVSVIYNVSGTSIYAAGRGYAYNSFISSAQYRGSILELPRHMLDISFTQRLVKSLQVKIGIQNMLNQSIRFAEDYNFTNKYEPVHDVVAAKPGDPTKEGDNISSSFKPGRYFITTLSYSF